MNESLYGYYEQELIFIRQLLVEFARKYPAAAGRLLLEPNRSADPHVERLIESFALLAGRVQQKLDDEFPEITTALLEALYPHFLAPIPSLGILQFQLDSARGQMPGGFAIPRHSCLHTEPVDGVPCRFRTAYPVTLWPIEIASASWQGPPFPSDLPPPRGAAAVLRLQFECLGGIRFSELGVESLRLHLHGDIQMLPLLYESLCNHAVQVVFRPMEKEARPAPFTMTPSACIAPVGFAPDQGLLPYAPPSRPGYRLLTELFVFPAKFWFLDLKGWEEIRRRGWQSKFEVLIFLDRTHNLLERSVDADTFRLGCAPIVNLFPQTAESVTPEQGKYEYRLAPDSGRPRGYEIYGVEAVSSAGPTDIIAREYPPFFSIRHPRRPDQSEIFWHASRSASLAENDQGTFVDLHLVDRQYQPRLPDADTLEVRTLCTNRDLPNQLRMSGEAIAFDLEVAAPLAGIRSLRPLTPPLRPRARRGRFWHLVSHLSLNFLSVAGDQEGRRALQEILSLYDFSDPHAGQQQLASVTGRFIEGITSVRGRRVTGRLMRERLSTFCRGLEIAVTLDEDMYPGTGAYLFACVLERFFGSYVSANSFVQLIARTSRQARPFKKWPPRPGELQTL